jgi:phosphate transport system protein
MERHFQQELNLLKERLLYMAGLVEKAVHNSTQAALNGDMAARQQVLAHEVEVNNLHIEIDKLALRLLALHQPVAGDLRFITAAMKINTDLERMGDQAVNIADSASFLVKHPARKQILDIYTMVELTEKMVRDSLDAFVSRDVELAQRIILRDDVVDRLKDKIFRDLIAEIKSNPDIVESEFDFILISRNLERIADHATNIAEDVIFMALGKDIRHHIEERDRKP